MKQEKKEGGERKTTWSLVFNLHSFNWLKECWEMTVAVSWCAPAGRTQPPYLSREVAFRSLLPKNLMPWVG